jgi:antitoxin FitA
MGQILIRNLDDEMIADYREAAARNNRSMEAELREALRVMRPKSPKRVAELLELSRRIRAMTPPGVKQTPSEQLVREIRDGNYD